MVKIIICGEPLIMKEQFWIVMYQSEEIKKLLAKYY